MLAIVWLILALVGVVGFVFGIKMTNKGKVQRNGDWTASGRFLWGTGLTFLVIFGICFFSRCFTTVDAGEVAVQVRFGRVLDRQLENGFNFKDPLSIIYTYGVRLRETTMDIQDKNALEALTSDKLSVLIDATIWWKILPDEPRMIYRYIATDEDRLGELVVFPAIRSAVRDAVVGYSFDDIIPKREELSQKIDEKLIVLTSGKGMKIERVLIRNVTPKDQAVTNAIGLKLQQQQELQAKEYELKKAEMDKKIRITNAEGIATAQNIIQKTLTSEYLQFEGIQMMKQLAGSPNTTFVFVPMNSGQAGLPMVYSLKDFEKKK